MKYFILMIKGFFIGVAKIIPGVSGAVLSISLGVYEKLINIISHPFKIKFEDLKFLFFFLFGVCLGIILLCDGVKWGLNNFYLPTMLLFIGLICGGIPEILNSLDNESNKVNYIIFIFSFILVLIITNLSKASVNSNGLFFLMGAIESLTTLIPGVSGTAIFMALGWYESLLDLIKKILTFNASFSISFSFILGFVIATILVSKLLDFIFMKYKSQAYFGVLGFMSGSLWIMFDNIFKSAFSVTTLFVSVFLFFLGIYLTIKINDFFGKF